MRSKKFLQAEQSSLDWDGPGLVAGVDEAGRGPLAGPVFAAAVILDELNPIVGLADSKKLSPKRRESLYESIKARALCCCVAQASVEEIDDLNILQATLLAMRRAVEGLRLKPVKVLVDGNRCPNWRWPSTAVVEGDAKCLSIAAASILAKTERDAEMVRLHARFPQYGLDQHKGYGTRMHVEALLKHGACEIHRRSFAPVRKALAGKRSVQGWLADEEAS